MDDTFDALHVDFGEKIDNLKDQLRKSEEKNSELKDELREQTVTLQARLEEMEESVLD